MNKIILQARAFYVQDFLTVKEIGRKTFAVSIILLLLENIQMLSISTYYINPFENDQFLYHIRSVIDFFRYYPVIGNSLEIRVAFTILGFVIQTYVILLLLYLVSKMSMQIQKKQQLHNLVLEQEQPIESDIHQDHISKTIVSIYYQLYPGFLQLPFIFCSVTLLSDIFQSQNLTLLEYFGLIISILMLAQQILIGLFINLHQFEYRLKSYDFLGKFQTQRVYLLYGLQLLVILLSGIKINNLVIQICGVLFSLINIFSDYYQLLYVDYLISRLHFSVNIMQILYQLVLILCEYGQPNLKISIVLLLLLLYPLIFTISNQLIVRQDLKSVGFHYLDMQKRIRRLYQIFKEQVQLKKQQRLLDPIQALQIYTFITTHLRECKIQRDRKMQKNIKLKYKCFCNDFFKNDDTFSTLQQMKSFATELIGQTLEDEIVENTNIDLVLIYIYFLVQVKKVPTQAIYEVIRLSMLSKGLPIKNIAIIHKLKHDALYKFNELVKKNDLVNQKYVFKKVYQYEESLNILKNNLCTVVKQEKDFYACILTQIIDIDLLLEIGFKLIQNIKNLEQQLQLLYKTNPQSNECDTIFNIFHRYIHYNKLRPKLYRREGQCMTQFLQSAERIIYDPGSCVIQITLLQPRGNVIRYTRSFQKAIGYTDEEIQDQNINRFMPQIIANDHDLYLDNFVERGRINVVRYAVRVILGKTKSQFVVPINTRLRIETSPTEFGATALITPVNLTYGYMMLNEQGQIEELTKTMYDDVFEKYMGLELDLVKGLDCLFFIPELAKIWPDLFDDNFERLDRKLDCQLILPNINKNMRKTMMSSRSTLMTKSQLQQNIIKSVQNSPHENVIFQVALHIVSLCTINLRLVILEIPEYKQLQNQKVTSKQMIQLRQRSSKLLITQNDFDTTEKAELLTSAINSPPGNINEYDLEYANLIEEVRMGEDLKYQLGIVNNSNPIQTSNPPFLLQSSQNLIEERVIPQLDAIELNSDQSNSQSENESDKLQYQADQNVLYNNGSVGSRSSQNNTTALKRQIKDCLSDAGGLSMKTKLFLLMLYTLVLTGYSLNYAILSLGIQKINENQKYENLPFQFSYFYNEFIISSSNLQNDSFKQFNKVCLEFYNDMLKEIAQTITLLPHIDVINNLTMETRMLNILSQMANSTEMSSETQVVEFFNNIDLFDLQQTAIAGADSTINQTDLAIFVISEEVILIFLLAWYIYICVLIIKMKTKIYKLFCTFSKETIQEQFLQFSSLWNQLNNSKFKNHETDEEQFETTMMRQYQKTVTSNMLDKHSKVGKQISLRRTNSAQVLFFLFIGLYAFMCSFYFIGSYILQQVTFTTVSSRYGEKIQFEIAQNQLVLSYASMAILMNQSAISNELLIRYNKTIMSLGDLRTDLSLYQSSYNNAVYLILIGNSCNLLSDGLTTSYALYDQLFSLDQCQQIPGLDKGLSQVFQELYSHSFEYLQAIQSNNVGIAEPISLTIQFERLYAQLGLQVIVEILTQYIITLNSSTFVVNTIMLVFATIIMTLSLLVTKMAIQRVKEQYKLSKQLLTLFPFERLMENAYVISFITLDLRFSV